MARWGWVVFGMALCALARPVAAQASERFDPHGVAAAQRTSARRVVLLDGTEPLARALRTALTPWGMELESIRSRTPESSLPGAALSARQLARELDARALVWLSTDGEGAALWLYEASLDAVRVRSFPDRSIDGALAAALALSVKTWLRGTEEALEPAGARSVAEPTVAPGAALGSTWAEPGPIHPASDSQRASGQPATREAARLRLLVNVEARTGALQPSGVEAGYGLELRGAVWRSEARATSLWLAAHADTGPPYAVSTAALRGDYGRWGGGVSLGVGQRLAAAWFAQLFAGMTVERASLSGTLLPEGIAVERSRWQALVQLRPELELAFAPVGFLLQPTLCAAPRQQRYLVGGVEVMRTASVWWSLGGAVSVDSFLSRRGATFFDAVPTVSLQTNPP